MRVDRGQWRDLSLHPDDLHQERQGVEAAGETGDDKIVHLDDLHVGLLGVRGSRDGPTGSQAGMHGAAFFLRCIGKKFRGGAGSKIPRAGRGNN